ncbi:NAD(P)/FAD-dependent oxidoreductase [Acetobacter sp.]|uniref:NAD(P)/FAD-dependent oxidoreductase n=1 Tax=Acetobacter sp. TaxID=440 RepID=UPI0039ECBB5E
MSITDDPRSHGLWGQSACAAPLTAPLSQDSTVDVVVVGAGYTGLSAALHLASAGRSVAVLEAKAIGYGGSGRNVGLVNAALWNMPSEVFETLGPKYGARVLTLLGHGPDLVFKIVERFGLDCEAEHTGTLHCAPDAAGLKALGERERQWQRLGAPVRLLDAAQTRRQTGTSLYRGALLDMRAGTIQPLSYARGLAGAAQAAGAAIYTGTPVTGAEKVGETWHVRTPGGTVRAKWVIVATNVYTVAPWTELREEVVALPYFNFATRPLSADQLSRVLPDRQGAWDTREVLTSFRLDRAGRLIVGSIGALKGVARKVHHDWSRRVLARLYPELAHEGFESEWYGTIGMTTDSVPRYHRFDDTVLSLSGYNGRGISTGTAFGRVLARRICGELGDDDMPLPVTPTASVPRRALQEHMYAHGSVAVHAISDRL